MMKYSNLNQQLSLGLPGKFNDHLYYRVGPVQHIGPKWGEPFQGYDMI